MKNSSNPAEQRIYITIIGNKYSGKTGLIERFFDNKLSQHLGHDSFMTREKAYLGNQLVRIALSKVTPDQLKHSDLLHDVRTPQAVIICLDATDSNYETSFDHSMKDINSQARSGDIKLKKMPFVCITKTDLAEHKQLVAINEMLAPMKGEYICDFFQTSALNSHSVDTMFEKVIGEFSPSFILKNLKNGEISNELITFISAIKKSNNAKKLVDSISAETLEEIHSIRALDTLLSALQTAQYAQPLLAIIKAPEKPYKKMIPLFEKRFNQLVKNDESYSSKDNPDYTTLHHAASYGASALCQELISQKQDVNATTELNRTPLFMAASNAHVDTVATLIKLKANPDIKTKKGLSAMAIALENACNCLRGMTHNASDESKVVNYSKIIQLIADSYTQKPNASAPKDMSWFVDLEKYYSKLNKDERILFDEYVLPSYAAIISKEQEERLQAINSSNEVAHTTPIYQ